MNVVATDTMKELLQKYGLNFDEWDKNRPSAKNSKVSEYLDIFKAAIDKDTMNKDFYQKLFFGELFLYYATPIKGDVALSILVDGDLASKLVTPAYIKEGLEWLMK